MAVSWVISVSGAGGSDFSPLFSTGEATSRQRVQFRLPSAKQIVTNGSELSEATKLEDGAFEIWVCTVGGNVKGHLITVCNHQMGVERMEPDVSWMCSDNSTSCNFGNFD